ncbi:MAG: DMT family transporter [Muribaculaceae bacterium]|nr:DMT family transporter [Muribaculaceae bacterium]
MQSKLKGNLYMFAAKTFSGLNENALRYLLPGWMNAMSGVVLRLGIGSLLFWIWGFFRHKKEPKARFRDIAALFAIGLVFVFGYMWSLLEGLSYTTPISSSIFISLQPVFVFIICLCLRTEKATVGKVLGILIGFGGAMLCVLTQKSSAVASDPFKGNMFCLMSAVLYSAYLVIEKIYLKRLSAATVSKWTFFGGAVAAAVVVCFTGWDAPVLHQNIFSVPMLVLLFVLIFPSFLSYLLQDFALKILPATVVSLYGDLILIVAAIASYILGQDLFSWWQILAILLMLVSVFLVERSERKTPQEATSVSAESANKIVEKRKD